MGIFERKEREKQQRRIDIIEAAETVFFSKGFEKATMDDVAKEVELSKGTLYLYFKSKEELYLEIIKKGVGILHGLFSKAVSSEPNGICKVRAIGEAFIKFYTTYPNYHNAMLYSQNRIGHNPDFSNEDCTNMTLDNESNTIFVDSIKEGITDGSIRADLDPQKTAILLWGETMGILQLVSVHGEKFEKLCNFTCEELIHYFFEFTFNALKK